MADNRTSTMQAAHDSAEVPASEAKLPSMTLVVIAPGSEAMLWNDVKAKVEAVMIESAGRVSYKVAYWAGTTLNHVWVDGHMVEATCGGGAAKIGFAESSNGSRH